MAKNNATNTPPADSGRKSFWVLVICLAVLFVVLFQKSFLPQFVLHNNDGPLGVTVRSCASYPGQFTGTWLDSNWLGTEAPMASVDVSSLMFWLGGPLFYAKTYVPIAQLLLGIGAWYFFRRMKFSPAACVLGGFAAALHSDYFSNSCWGQASHSLTLAAMFVALGALQSQTGARSWLKAIVAGMAVGVGVTEGFDVAALSSLVIAAYVIYQAWVSDEPTSNAQKIFKGGLRLALVAGFAGFLAAQAVTGLIGTQIKGIAGIEAQDGAAKQAKWEWATQWSFPKAEILSELVPGIFGYRMDTPDGGQYWGIGGRDASWERYYEKGKQGPAPGGFARYSGAGDYGGPMIFAVALFAVLQSFRGKNSAFSATQRRFVWFWAALASGAVLLAFGKFAPFYQLYYALPYASTIRNPGKFLHWHDWSVLVLFGYGAQALCARLWENRPGGSRELVPQWQSWWKTATLFERRWVYGSLIAVGASLLGWMIYASSSAALQHYLVWQDFDAGQAALIAKFSASRVGWFVLFLALTLGAMALVVCGYFSGKRALTGAILLGAILVADLAHANLPWIVYWNYKLKYETNPVIDKLREKSYEQRVAILPGWIINSFNFPEQVKSSEQYLEQLYRIEWMQHHFQMYDIQCLDIVQMPRAPKDYITYSAALQVHDTGSLFRQTRQWELSSTRYIFGLAGFADLLDKQFDGGRGRFRVAQPFKLQIKPGFDHLTKLEELTAVPAAEGEFGLLEFTGALPKVKLFTRWEKPATNNTAAIQAWLDTADKQLPKDVTDAFAALDRTDIATLKTLGEAEFDPWQKVLVAEDVGTPASDVTTNTAASATITSYQSKHITIETHADAPGVLLLNDRYAPGWQVLVDDKPEQLLRCNFLMRGVKVGAGAHKVEFVFRPPTQMLYVSITAILIALALTGWLIATREKNPAVIK